MTYHRDVFFIKLSYIIIIFADTGLYSNCSYFMHVKWIGEPQVDLFKTPEMCACICIYYNGEGGKIFFN